MKFWYNGFYENQSEQNNRVEISESRWQELLEGQSNGLEIYTRENGEPDLRQHKITEEDILLNLRTRREQECFSVINRGQIWYDLLSLDQKHELVLWYNAWLNVTDTKAVPEVPIFLKKPETNEQKIEPQNAQIQNESEFLQSPKSSGWL